MEVRFNTKPTQDVLDKYCKKLQKFLSAHNIHISINVRDIAPILTQSMNGIETSREKLWLNNLVIDTPEFKNISISVPRFGIDDAVTDQEIWADAWQIQNDLYRNLKLQSRLNDKNDPYWKLCDHPQK